MRRGPQFEFPKSKQMMHRTFFTGCPGFGKADTDPANELTSAKGRYCCKSLFATLSIKFPGRGCGTRKIVWGTTSLCAELTGDFGNAPEGTSTSDYCLLRLLARNLSRGILGLLQQYRPEADSSCNATIGGFCTSPAQSKSIGNPLTNCNINAKDAAKPIER